MSVREWMTRWRGWPRSSISAQCVYYYHCRSVLSRLYPERPFDSKTISEIVDHIIRFTRWEA